MVQLVRVNFLKKIKGAIRFIETLLGGDGDTLLGGDGDTLIGGGI